MNGGPTLETMLADLLAPMRDLMEPVATRTKLDYDRTRLTPCRNQTPKALGYPA